MGSPSGGAPCRVSHSAHIPVLATEVVGRLAPRPGDTYVDCTAGHGGHAALIAPHLAPGGLVVLGDLDPGNLQLAEHAVRLALGGAAVEVRSIRGNFAELPRRLEESGLRANCLLADLGFSSGQVDDPARGLSFLRDGPLDMRLDPSAGVSAADLVNGLPEAELARIIEDFGEERHARRIARKVVRAREQTPISTTGRLASLVRDACPPAPAHDRIDPATRTFQALRIAVNDELGSLQALLAAVSKGVKDAASGNPSFLATGARVCMIAFHSLEDRPIKQTFAALCRDGVASDAGPGLIRPGEAECAANPRARSAKLRAIRVVASSGPPPGGV